jgi:hypothetical protein
MYNECRYVLPSGLKCTDGQLQHSDFCYYHRNFHEQMHAVPPRPGTPFRLPSLEDACGCRFAIQQVCWGMGDKRIPPNEASIYLRAVGLTMRLFPRRPRVSRKPVRALHYDSNGMEMAEPATHCEPPRDCVSCESPCQWIEYYEGQIKKIKKQIAEQQEQNEPEQKEFASRQSQPGDQSNSEPSAQNPDQQSNTDQTGVEQSTTRKSVHQASSAQPPRNDKYDNELPNVRALLLDMERKGEQEQKIEAERLAKIEANKRIFDNHPLPARPKAS